MTTADFVVQKPERHTPVRPSHLACTQLLQVEHWTILQSQSSSAYVEWQTGQKLPGNTKHANCKQFVIASLNTKLDILSKHLACLLV